MDKEESLLSSEHSPAQLTHGQKRFYASALCEEARGLLQSLVDNPDYNTGSSTDSSKAFVERHLKHLCMYPRTDLQGYMSNLKLMTNVKRSKSVG